MKKLLLSTLALLSIAGADAQCWKHVSAVHDRSMAVKDDGTLWYWGANGPGGGILPPGHIYEPTQISTETNWKSTAIGMVHTLALKTDGTLWVWGNNTSGQVGVGEILEVIAPVQLNEDTNWKTIACGWHHSLAIKTDGTLWFWGLDSNYEYVMTPTQIGTDNNWVSISADVTMSMAVKSDGTLWKWGNPVEGNGPNAPVQIGTDTDWAIGVAGYYGGAIKTDGKLWIFGQDSFEQFGTDSWLSVGFPVRAVIGIKSDGSLWSWGGDYSGQLGNGPDGPNEVNQPTLISENPGWEYIIPGDTHVYAVNSDDSLWGWGDNLFGALGFPQGTSVQSPVNIGEVCEATAGLNDNILTSISLYPNPTSNTLTLANAESLSIEKLTVTDLTGKTVLTQNSNASQIDVQQLPVGMYFLNVSASEGVQHLKFIKQ
jgi:hypothetical protein